MKKIIIIAVFITTVNTGAYSQERYNALNIGAGMGYYYGSYGSPSFNLNCEFDMFRNFTLAAFIGYSSYRDNRYWGSYHENIIPVGIKGSYYFDELFEASEKWDFYLGASLGYLFRSATWGSGYYGDKEITGSHLFGNLHIGSEYHLSTRVGLFLDVSTGISSFGLGVHF